DSGASTGTDSGGGTITPSSGISIVVEPNGNHASEIVDAIKAAKTSVYMTMYELDNSDVMTALVAQAKVVDVKVVLDGSTATKSFNQPAFTALNKAKPGTAVWSSSSFTYTHEKCVIVDGAEAWIMTMNLTQSAPDDDREYLALDKQAADVAEATAIFKADFAGTAITPTGNLVVADTNARASLVALIGTATASLDLELEEFSDLDKNGIVDAIVAALKNKVAVKIVVANNTPPSDQPTAISDVKAAGATVVQYGGTSSSTTSSNPYVAAKTILVDCKTGTCKSGYVGSENMTANSLGYNRELGVIFSDASELAKIYTTVTSDYGKGTPQ
ncbi:MAG TPA: phospholipase D-like domain-containing protein, partial [Polyangiaceae bacterium]